ncbi:uncharacterized protein LOC123216963 isoform X2 [Mangifera indica]|uniref:uncharacterized protein LOC123216963 isoform X2 n=1 Tax=Mangifera indica TaxID=29780 RepID=UPI001CFA7097|nr:uncharacterized protein LOC123216963 isoform X2 [Mangifera indica]
MEDKHSSEPIPEGWEFVTKLKKNGSQVSNFDFRKKKKSGQSSEPAPNHIEECLDSEKESDTEKSLESGKDNDSDTEKSMDSEKASNIKRSLDSEKDTDPGKSEFPENDLIETISAYQLDSLPSIFEFMAYMEPMQISSEQAPMVEIPNFVPDTFPSDSGLNAGLESMQISSVQAPIVEIPTFVPHTFRSTSGLNAGLEPMQTSSEQDPVKSSLIAGKISGAIPCNRNHPPLQNHLPSLQAPVLQIACSHPHPRTEAALLPRNSRIMEYSHPHPNPQKPEVLHWGPRII